MNLLRSLAAYVLLFTFTFATAQSEPNPAPLLGYSPQSSSTERDWEKKLQNGVQADNIRENMNSAQIGAAVCAPLSRRSL